jgi:hypothetical protein
VATQLPRDIVLESPLGAVNRIRVPDQAAPW